VDDARLERIRQKLQPMWQTLPKNVGGNVDRRSLRYLVHRHFNRESAIHVRGFEPSRPASATGWGGADILSQRVPAFVESVLESRHKAESGFSLGDAAHVVAALEQLIFDAEGALLSRVYTERRLPAEQSLSRTEVGLLLEAYVVHWMVGEDAFYARMLLNNQSMLPDALPHWHQLAAFARGQADALEHRRQSAPVASRAAGLARAGHNALSARYSFEDAHSMVGDITRSFASYWEAQCESMKLQLVEMDTHRTGRVPLSKFYGTGLDADWRFGESEEYLRELGALDESSPWRGTQVIISNYLQAASNCIISREKYLVCCVNECEGILGDIEAAVGGPVASPGAILEVVENMTTDEDEAIDLSGTLREQLRRVADSHGGKVPLHGRLFAQWLHFVFPRECVFPHRAGAASATTPLEFGDNYGISPDEVEQRVAESVIQEDLKHDLGSAPARAEALGWMTQWSEEEDLPGDYSTQLRAPWDRSRFRVLGGAAAAAACVVGLLWAAGGKAGEIGPHGPAAAPVPATKVYSV